MQIKKAITYSLLTLLFSNVTWAQEFEDDLNVIELEIEKGGAAKKAAQPQAQPQAPQEVPAKPDVRKVPITDLADLSRLAPFKEVSVIQKRFMPKTGRFQLFGGLGVVTNDPFFTTVSAIGRAGYFFSETLGVELNYFANSTSQREVTKELKDALVDTEALVQPQSYMGVDLMWAPIYGKMTWINERIVPFDLYFSGGFGSTKTQAESAGTFHIGTGQIFALSKGMSFRWDFSWNFYSAKGVDGQTGSFNNLFLSAGFSFFFPEAGYR